MSHLFFTQSKGHIGSDRGGGPDGWGTKKPAGAGFFVVSPNGLLEVRVTTAHLFFGDPFLMDDMRDGGLKEGERRQFEDGAHRHADYLGIHFRLADRDHTV